MLPQIQYISNDANGFDHISSIENACNAGVKFVQLRIKHKQESEVIELAKLAKKITDKYNAHLIINDFPHVAKQISAHGVHLGLTDLDPLEARELLGENAIIGATANTIDDIRAIAQKAVQYIGLGPLRFTSTKKELSPVLGFEGYNVIINEMNRLGINIPIFAIGGIEVEDLEELKNTGVYGVAVSSLLTNTDSKMILKKMHLFNKL